MNPIAAPTQGVNSAGISSGAVILGLLLVAWLLGRWKVIPSESRKLIGIVAVALILLAGAGGLIGSLFYGVRQAGDGIGQTVTGTTTGR
ncbi:hypothetical protein EAO71_35170 [Streptomyces sp. ms191]|uniref:hypothetical protein n=1 Tax=Streptomyces sp. ms191 TaxID=1827978 RepID=UPI0011CE24D5|nr:hypothetical protein [Streptomyces sp. ms191]TXS16069.1 hypothetical protein EAO71_35170 [Streptomyces sp. ms191]